MLLIKLAKYAVPGDWTLFIYKLHVVKTKAPKASCKGQEPSMSTDKDPCSLIDMDNFLEVVFSGVIGVEVWTSWDGSVFIIRKICIKYC